MVQKKKRLTDSVLNFLSKRAERRQASVAAGGKDDGAVVFDTITLESIMSHRGQNPFPEEEGEMGFMPTNLRGRSLESR